MRAQQLLPKSFCIVTNCTARKRALGTTTSLPTNLDARTLPALAKAWVAHASAAPRQATVRDLYLGRAFRDGCATAKTLDASLYVVSAGFGLVSADDRLPNYNLTTSEGTGSIRGHLAGLGATATDWWDALNRELAPLNSLSKLIAATEANQIFIAMPSSYLSMVATDLDAVSESKTDRLRIFTSRLGRASLPVHLQTCVMPYDDRLEAISGHAGTRSDFPQRALRHFVQVLAGHQMLLGEAKAKVDSSLGSPVNHQVTQRAKATDSEIQALLIKEWVAKRGTSSKLLRFLRDEAQIACEQRRFRDLWRELKAQRPT